MLPKLDLRGRSFHRWRVLDFHHGGERLRFWICECECGRKRVVNQNNLVRSRSRSCGCLQKEVTSKRHKTHGKSHHVLYSQWNAMRARCSKPHHRDYRYYGARGISVCLKWREFAGFLEDMEASWSAGLTIERVNVNGNYEPANVRWATQAEQARNTRRNVLVDSPWGRLTAAECARKIGIRPSVFLFRLRRGWISEQLFSPSRQYNRWNPATQGERL